MFIALVTNLNYDFFSVYCVHSIRLVGLSWASE